MYHGIIQELEWSGPGSVPAREDRAVSARQGRIEHGRIWRLRYDGRPAVPATRHEHRAAGDSRDHAGLRAAADVQRDAGAARRALHASERLVARHGAAAAGPEAGQVGRARAAADGGLERLAEPLASEAVPARDSTRCGRSKASARSTPALVREEMADKSPRMRVQAIRASETLYKAGDKSFADDYRALTKDPDPNVVIQALLTASLFKLPDTADLVKAAQAANKSKGVALIGDRLLAPPTDQLRRHAVARRSAPTKRSGCSRVAMFSAPCASRVTAPTAPARRWKARPGDDDGAAARGIASRAGASRLRHQGAAEGTARVRWTGRPTAK